MSFFRKIFKGSEQSPAEARKRDIDEEQPVDWTSLLSQYWNLNHGKYLDVVHGKTIREKKELSARYVNFNNNKNEVIVKDICMPRWYKMKALYIRENRIKSIECLIHMDAPKLTAIDLRGNHITRVQSVRKFSFKLERLYLQGNPILNWRGLAQIDFISEQQRSREVSTDMSFASFTPSLKCHDISEWARSQPHYITYYLAYYQNSILSLVSSRVLSQVFNKKRDESPQNNEDYLRRLLESIEEDIRDHEMKINRLVARRDELRVNLERIGRRRRDQQDG